MSQEKVELEPVRQLKVREFWQDSLGPIKTRVVSLPDGGKEIWLPATYNIEDGAVPVRWFEELPKELNLMGGEEIEKLRVGVVELGLPPLMAVYLVGKGGLSVEEMRKKYSPGDNLRTMLVGVYGWSVAGKSAWLAIEAYRGNIELVSVEPFSEWSSENFLEILRGSREISPEMSIEKMWVVIQEGMRGQTIKDSLCLADKLDGVLERFEIRKVRPEMIVFDVPGISDLEDREPHIFHLMTAFSLDYVIAANRLEVEPSERHREPLNWRTIEAYHQQWESGLRDQAYKGAWDSQSIWALRLS